MPGFQAQDIHYARTHKHRDRVPLTAGMDLPPVPSGHSSVAYHLCLHCLIRHNSPKERPTQAGEALLSRVLARLVAIVSSLFSSPYLESFFLYYLQ